jgi:hypothetical protein
MEKEGHLQFLDIDIFRKTEVLLGKKYIRNPPIPISTYTRIPITILLKKHSVLTSLIHRTKPVTKIPSPKN